MNKAMEEKLRLSMEECLSGMDALPSLEARVLERIGGRRRAPVRLTVAMAAALILTLMMAAALAAGAIAGWFRVEQKQTGAIISCVSDGDTLYLLSAKGLYTWETGQEKPSLLLAAADMRVAGLTTEALLCMPDGLPALLHPESGSLWRICAEGLQPVADYAGTALDNDDLHITAAACAGDSLLLRALPHEALPHEARLYRWHMPTGSVEQLPLTGVVGLCACTHEQALVLWQDPPTADTPQYRLSRLDAATGSIAETLCTAPIQGIEHIMVHPKTGQIAAFVAGAPSLWNGSSWTPLQGYALSAQTDTCAIIGDGIAAVNYNDLQVIPFATPNSMTTLHIRGPMAMNNEDATFQQEAPGIAVQREKDPALNAAAVQQAIAEGDTTDLFQLWISRDLVALFKNGTLAALPASLLLEEDAQAMLPVFREGLCANGRMYAVPSAVSVQVWESTQTLPDTFAGLPETCMNEGWTKERYAEEWLKAYILACAPNMPDFRLPAVTETLQALRDAPFAQGSPAGRVAITTNVALELSGRSSMPASGRVDHVYALDEPLPHAPILWRVPCTAVPGAKQVVPARLMVYVLNPNAANPEPAIRYLESIAAHRRPDTEALLKPDAAAPVLQPSVEKQIDQMIAEQRAYEEAHGLEPDAEHLEMQIAAIKADPVSWAVTEERLQVYREEIVPYVSLQLHPLLSGQAKAPDGIFSQMLQAVLACVNGEATPEDCVQTLERLLRAADSI